MTEEERNKLEEGRRALAAAIDDVMMRRGEVLEEFARAYLAEKGRPPSECALVERRSGDGLTTSWYFRPRVPEDIVSAELLMLKQERDEFAAAIVAAEWAEGCGCYPPACPWCGVETDYGKPPPLPEHTAGCVVLRAKTAPALGTKRSLAGVQPITKRKIDSTC